MESEYGRDRADSGSTQAPRYFSPPAFDTKVDVGSRHSRKNDQNEASEYSRQRKPRHVTDDNEGRGSYEDRQALTEEFDSSSRRDHRHRQRPLHAAQGTRQQLSTEYHIETSYQDEPVRDNRHNEQSSARHYDLSSTNRSKPIAVPRGKAIEIAEDELEIPERHSRRRRDPYADSPRSMGRSPQSFTASPRHRPNYDQATPDRHNKIQRRDSTGQQDSRRTSIREQDQGYRYSESPRYVSRTYGDMNRIGKNHVL